METQDTNKRAKNKARNRAAILEAARQVFIDIGYDAATVRDVIGRTDLAPGTFYNYFPDKRSLLVAIANEISAEGRERTRAARATATDVPGLVRNGFRAYFEFIAHDPSLFELMRRNNAALRTLDLDETGFAAGLEDVRKDIEQAVAARLLPEMPVDFLTRAFGAIAFEIGAQMVESEKPDVEAATRFATQFCLTGLVGLAEAARNEHRK